MQVDEARRAKDQRVPVRHLAMALVLATVLVYNALGGCGPALTCSAEFRVRLHFEFGGTVELVEVDQGLGERRSLIGGEWPRPSGPTGTGSTAHASAYWATAFPAQPPSWGNVKTAGTGQQKKPYGVLGNQPSPVNWQPQSCLEGILEGALKVCPWN